MANLLNPHPYLFWFVIGAPKLIEAAEISWMTAAAFLAGLYVCLIGAKILVAFLVGRSRAFLKSRGYVYVNRILGAVLAGFSIFLPRRNAIPGLRRLGPFSARDQAFSSSGPAGSRLCYLTGPRSSDARTRRHS